MAKTLSRRIEAIEYIHAQDGKPYRHDFKKGGTISLLKDGSVKVRARDKKLWDDFDVNGTSQPFLINPPAGRSTTTTRGNTMAKKRKMSAAQRKYFGGKRKSNPRGRTKTIIKYRTRSRNPAGNPPKRRKRHRRNPPLMSINGLLARMQRGAVDALCVVGGRVGVRAISKQFSYDPGSVMDTVVETVGALAIGMAAEQVLGSDRARFVLAGALSNGIEAVIKSADIPHVSELISATPNASVRTNYPAADRGRGMNAWQQLNAWQGGGPALQRMGAVDSLPASTVTYLPS